MGIGRYLVMRNDGEFMGRGCPHRWGLDGELIGTWGLGGSPRIKIHGES
jgi:hypothetical protein